MTASGARRSQVAPGRDELQRAIEMGARLVAWYERHGRDFSWRGDADPFRVAVTEVLLQRTRAETIERFIGAFLAAYPSAGVLARTPVDELERTLGPIGLQHRRAASLRALAQGWDLTPGAPWETRPGVGQYVARAIRVATLGTPEAMVDSNFVRMLQRVFGGNWMADYRYDRRLQALASAVIEGGSDARRANWAVLDLGALVCTPRRPSCLECPLVDLCLEGKRQTKN